MLKLSYGRRASQALGIGGLEPPGGRRRHAEPGRQHRDLVDRRTVAGLAHLVEPEEPAELLAVERDHVRDHAVDEDAAPGQLHEVVDHRVDHREHHSRAPVLRMHHHAGEVKVVDARSVVFPHQISRQLGVQEGAPADLQVRRVVHRQQHGVAHDPAGLAVADDEAALAVGPEQRVVLLRRGVVDVILPMAEEAFE